ncbi:hypothetical protein CspeluHIS016_0900590 [Cutaneotrichosporon spelunceum]|uniref:Elongator complex protein 4 n=1 Tax=Cutaneotrichosporon spelunceum TaxID=1672016 RepID=A0AAD3YFC6_9TREE|nr:hypothetical protein CspeluHIS016_0900590 [Cutaneotrichosporon spelunceum]
MPSFTRRPRPGTSTSSSSNIPSSSSSTPNPSQPPLNLPGTKPYPSAPIRFVSTGIPSLDDVLGSLPLGSTLSLLAPDPHTQWARLVARHAAAAGILDGQRLLILSTDEEWAAGLPWSEPYDGSESESEAVESGPKIAWRYDKLTKFQTSVGSSRLAANTTIPGSLLKELEADGTIAYAAPDLKSLQAVARALESGVDRVLRIIVPDLGGREWRLSKPEIVRFLLCLRFGGSPGHFRAFTPLHGLLIPHTLPTTHHLLAPGVRHSTLLGVRDGGEQNLGFRLKRKRFVVESVHLGIEGGTSERRTAPVENAVAVEGVERVERVESTQPEGVDKVENKAPVQAGKPEAEKKEKKQRARVRFGDDEVAVSIDKHEGHAHHTHTHSHGPKKVEIRHDRPDLYEF